MEYLFRKEVLERKKYRLEGNISLAIKELEISRVIIAHRQETIDSVDRVIRMKSIQEEELGTLTSTSKTGVV